MIEERNIYVKSKRSSLLFKCAIRIIWIGNGYVELFAGAVVIVSLLDLQLHVQSVSITTKVVSSKPVHGKVSSIQYYVTKVVSDLRQDGGFHRVLRFPPPIKLRAQYSWNIVESGVKHKNQNKTKHIICYGNACWTRIIWIGNAYIICYCKGKECSNIF